MTRDLPFGSGIHASLHTSRTLHNSRPPRRVLVTAFHFSTLHHHFPTLAEAPALHRPPLTSYSRSRQFHQALASMAQNIVEQFTSMLNKRFSLGTTPSSQSKQSPMAQPMRETVTYPKIKVTADHNFCLDPSVSFDHVLSCGHLINTALPNEPCAPNCDHVAGKADSLDKSLKMKNCQTISIKDFYCDACVETEIEMRMPSYFSSAEAEERRATLRAEDATKLGKATEHRKCYIAQKSTSIPCHSDGSLSSKYKPREQHHLFDASLPQIGENMFEDVDPNPEIVPSKTMMQAEEDIGDTAMASGDTHTKHESRTLSAETDANKRLAVKASRRAAGRANREVAEAAGDTGIAARRPLRKRSHRTILEDDDDDGEEDEEDAPPVKRKRAAAGSSKAAKKWKGKD
jgi:hypothetical protein